MQGQSNTVKKQGQSNLVRKQFLISEGQIEKLRKLAKKEHVSGAKMLRRAIDAYDPDAQEYSLGESELLELVHKRVKEAIRSTKQARKTITACIKSLSATPVEEVRTYRDENIENQKVG